ncbi:MAG: hypothetical protein RML72_02580, partial [Bacteroidia bacterium]|nr:hypothetical protein [Bacteroidia bacterium]
MTRFDTTIKQLFLPTLPSFAKKAFQLDIQNFQEINPQLPTTLQRNPDFLAHIELANHQNALLHVEFQAQNHPQIHARMLEYLALLFRKYTLPIYQFVLYLGNEPLTMPNSLSLPN